MRYRLKMINGLVCSALLAVLFVQVPVLAKSTAASTQKSKTNRYIVILDDMPLATYDGREMSTPDLDQPTTRLAPTRINMTGAKKLSVHTDESKQYLQFLDARFKSFRGEALLRLGHQLNPVFRYRNVLNGIAVDLTASEAKALLELPAVSSVKMDELHHVRTDSGPAWIGADIIHNGAAGHSANGGEGVVIGMIDTGINWDHPSFTDPGQTGNGWNHVNPYGTQLGLCSDSEVNCNDKLIGIYDMVEDDPGTELVEENTKGKDNDGHGSHTSSTAAGNPLSFSYNGLPTSIAGVAPNANIISYRVCYSGDLADPDDDSCAGSAILKAIDQAVADDVDIINYSLGTDSPHDPWIQSTSTYAFLNVRAAGIFVATSAGNSGPNGATIGSPANAPWITSVGNATHDRVYASALENLSGGNTTAPDDLIGASFSDGIGVRKIVHAKDFGNALCGTGPAELAPNCGDLSGTTNPFGANTFNGEIVVCDRGIYGRVEKGNNVRLAGAGGYILANTAEQGELIVADQHCLPATHLGERDGDLLRDWLNSGSNHQGSLSGFSVFHIAEAGDVVARSSSRGPALPPVNSLMKPDVIAPGTDILAAFSGDNSVGLLTGTSMSSPHVAGGAALLKAIHPDWTPAIIASALTMTATPDQAVDFDGSPATVHKRGAGRIRLDQAVNAALYLNETENAFKAADPDVGGDPKDLNLAGLVDANCVDTCSFRRTVTDLAGGANWTAVAEDLPVGVSVSISPDNFTLANGASRLITVEVDVRGSGKLQNWNYGKVRLSSAGKPDAVFPLAVFSASGSLPSNWVIDTDKDAGWKEFGLNDLVSMPDATFTSGGLVASTVSIENLPQDPTDDLPYDNATGTMTVLHSVPDGALWLHTETLDSTAVDLDLFVGLDANGDGIAQESEQLCTSTTPTAIELCDLFLPVAGEYWVLVQNWDATGATDQATLVSVVVPDELDSSLVATGDGIILDGANTSVRLSWDNINVRPGAKLFGAVGLGNHRESPNNIGVIPVNFTKTALASPDTVVLMDGLQRGFALDANGTHDRAYIDVPAGTDSLTISVSGADDAQNNELSLELYRLDFDEAFANAPAAVVPNTSGSPLASASGSGGNGPVVTVEGSALTPGRWYAVVSNTRNTFAAANVQADMTYSSDFIPLQPGMWQASSREGMNQGFEWAKTESHRAFLWYTYDEDGLATWYLAAGPKPVGNVWVGNLLRFTNDGVLQQDTRVGHVSITKLGEQDSIFSFVLFGEDGSDRERPSLPNICPTIDGSEQSYHGSWSRAATGVGGGTVVVNATSQAYVHYIYDDDGNPVWLIALPENQGPTVREMPLYQFGGYCATCTEKALTTDTVGVFTRDFLSEEKLNWNLNYALVPPLSGSIDRTDEVNKLTLNIACQ